MLKCYKCGGDFDPKPYGNDRDAVVRAASDHASQHGCDYPATHISEVTKQLKKEGK